MTKGAGVVDDNKKKYSIDMYMGDDIAEPTEEQGCIQRGYCCTNYPGWFGPGEIEKAAELLKIEPDDFVKKYVVVDGIEVDGHGWVDVFVPIMVDGNGEMLWEPATRVPGFYKSFPGPCIFYKNKKCEIYAARPIECKTYFCGQSDEKNLSHEDIARMWMQKQH